MIEIEAAFAFETTAPTDVVLQFEAALIPEQTFELLETRLEPHQPFMRVSAEDDIGDRVLLEANGRVDVLHRARATVNRLTPDLAALAALVPHDLPGETLGYLFDSRYCPADKFQSFVSAEFDGSEGGARIVAICNWIAANIEYALGSSHAGTDAAETVIERRGVCRDFAHVMVTMARASAIPARYVSCFAPGVDPQDFHAVAEVFLADPATPGGGAWYLVDATGMADPAETVKIGVGRDAADVSFLTSFGASELLSKSVTVRRI